MLTQCRAFFDMSRCSASSFSIFPSSFSKFHDVVSRYKIGTLCMGVVEQELKKYDAWREELRKKNKDQDKVLRKYQDLLAKQEPLLRGETKL